jgi:hypothetical protein
MLLIISIGLTLYDKELLNLRLFARNNSIDESSKDYFRVNLDLTSNTAVCQSNDKLIIYILSTVTNYQRRKTIRSTWASPLTGICFVFILGKIENYDLIRSIINDEKEDYRDIVQIDHNETYANVVYKEVAALQWSAHFYPSIPFLFKTDDDLIIDSILILDIVKVLVTNLIDKSSYISKYRPILNQILIASDRSTFFRGGWSMNFQPTLRSSKFAVKESVWPYPVLPLYCSGFGWLMSKDIRNKLVKASFTYPIDKIVWIGDAFASGFLAKAANVKCASISIDYEQTFSANCSCLMIQRPMLTVCSSTFHGGINGDKTKKYKEYEKAWKVIQQRHSLLNGSMTDIYDC